MGLCSSSLHPSPLPQTATQNDIEAILAELQRQGHAINSLNLARSPKPKKNSSSPHADQDTFPSIAHKGGITNIASPYKLHEVMEQTALLQRRIQECEQWKVKTVIRALVKVYSAFSYIRVQEAFDVWKTPAQDFSLYSELEYSSIQGYLDDESISFARGLLDFEKQQVLKNNPLSKYLDKTLLERAMPRASLYKLFEDLLEKKYEADLVDSEQERPIRPLSEFLLEYLNRLYGLKRMAVSVLCSLLRTLKELYEEQDEYAAFLCRLLQVLDPDPILTPLAVYLLKVRIDFNRIAARLSRSTPKSPQQTKHRRSAFVVDVFNLMHQLFESDKTSRNITIRMLKPAAVSDEDHLLFRISYRLAKQGLTPDKLYASMAEERQLNREGLVAGLRKQLDMHLAPSEVSMLTTAFSIRHGVVAREAFLARLNPTLFHMNCKDTNYTVPNTTYYAALVEAYDALQVRDLAHLRSWFHSYTNCVNSSEQFAALLQILEPTIAQEAVDFLYQEAGQFGQITSDVFSALAVKYNVGGFGLRDFKRDARLSRKTSETPNADTCPSSPSILASPSSPNTYTTRPRSSCLPDKF